MYLRLSPQPLRGVGRGGRPLALAAVLLAALLCGGCLGGPKPAGALVLSVSGDAGALGAVAVLDGRRLVTLADGRAEVRGLARGTHRLWLGAAHYRSRSEVVSVATNSVFTLRLDRLGASARAVVVAAPARALAGDRFEVDLAFNATQAAQGVALRLRYGPAGVRFLGATAGGLWGAPGKLFIHAGTDGLGPYIALAAGRAGGSYTGSGTIVTLAFAADVPDAVGFWLDPERAEIRAASGERLEADYDLGGGLTVVN